MSGGQIQVERQDGVATLTVCHPERRNAMTLAMWQQLATALRELEGTGVRVLVLTGAGARAFVSGADISEFDQARDGEAAVAGYNQAVAQAQRMLAEFSAPTVALIQGACMGGGIGLALACDLRYASASARFRMPAARLGLGYSLADMRRLVDVVGAASAFDLFYTARILDAEQAERRGLVHERYADDDFARQTQARVRGIAANAPLSLRAAKAAILATMNPPAPAGTEAIDALVRQCFDSADYAEGRRAFAEKRDPVFLGR
ncbi:enoyl-CoA hydratase [Achromobacter insolitus]|uniref:enoyl-CoA hydratase n=1 Tax=Achromobacter insolitus TaxID=217204 RepID=UPI001EEE32EF|nr:enoyl-CoA hydratase [Achromobacter insolitus]